MTNFKAVISYDGTDFRGVAEQLNGPDEKPIRTVVGELRPIIQMVCQGEPKIVVSGRTDKGVHAREQVITFSFPDGCSDFDPMRLAHVANKKLNPEIIIHRIDICEQDFHARYSAKGRTYRYVIDNNSLPNYETARYAWHIAQPLNLEEMNAACVCFIGEQDFSSVCKKDESMPHNIREVFTARLSETDKTIYFEISANAFCWNMVRSIVGVLVDVGRGKMSASDVPALLAKKDRTHNSPLAPPHGLTLWSVQY